MLSEQTAHLIDQRGAVLEQLLADPMQGLQVLLRFALDRHKPHRRPGHRFAYRLGIVGVILVALAVGGRRTAGSLAFPCGRASRSRAPNGAPSHTLPSPPDMALASRASRAGACG